LTSIVTAVNCFGDSTGAINITAAGGTSPYTYAWSSNANSEDLNNLLTGNYTVTITDTNLCVLISSQINVPQPIAPLSISHVIDDVNCFGGNDGAIDLTVNGGTAPYNYAWSNGQTTQDVINLITDTFNVVVTDVNNCIIHDSVIFVPQPAASYILSTTNTDVLCYGFSTGAIDFSVTGGTLPYTYSWSNGQTTQDIDSLSVGSYEVIVTDAKGCKDSITTTLIQPLTPLLLSITKTDALCIGGTQGTIDITAVGGTAPYTYFWNNNEIVPDIDSLNQGFYYCLVTDMHGCFDTISATILDPNNNMVLSITNTDVQCFAGSDGTVNLTVQFGTPGYSYLWNTGDTTQDLSNVPIGTYSVDVTDFNTCGAFISITVDQPATPVSGTTSTIDVLCKTFATGSIDASASGGIAPYTYLWSNNSTNQDIQNLTAGIYTLTIKDSHNCILAISDTIFEPATAVSATDIHTNVNCFGGSDGTINLIPAGGVGNYTFLWSNSQTTENIDSLILGTYNVTITDSNNCVFPYSVLITQPIAPISLATSITNVSCFGGSNGIINLTPNGGTAPYTYFWSDSTTNQDLTNAPIGTYSVVVTDTNNCIDSIVGTIIQPTLLVISGSITPVICHGDSTGTATVVANGGTPGYSYLWSNGDQNALNDTIVTGTYTVLVTDSLGCQDSLSVFVNEPTLLTSSTTHIDNPCYGNSIGSVSVVPAGGIAPYTYLWSNSATTGTTSNLIAGVYTVVVKDFNNCIVNDTSEVLQPLAPLAINFAITDNICFNGTSGAIDATITGGTAPYSYLWNTTATTQDINNLPIGIYTLSIIDTQNCVLSKTDTIIQPTQIDTANVILDDISCNGFSDGSVNLTTVGGTAPYTYLWSNNTTNEDLTNVIIGTYTVTITDNNLCNRQFTYTLNQPLPLISTYTTIEPLCYAYSDGSITLNTTGGTTPYAYSWTNGSTSAINSGIVTGNYTATITDAQNCVFVLPCFIDQPDQIQVSFNVSDTVGCDPTTIEFTNTSDEQFISTWQFGDGNSAVGNTNIENTYNSPGCFDVSLTVESPIGCSNSVIYPSIICINPTPTAGISANPTTLDSSNPETEILNTTTGAVSYEWDMGDNGLYNFFQPGMYTYPMYTLNEFLITLTATSDKGCVDTAQYTIFFDNSLIFYVPNTFTPDGNEYNNVFKPILTSLVASYQLQIYNRWGELIFESFDKEVGWDGSYKGGIVQNGAYNWVIKIKTDGTQTHVKRGNVMLLR
jgi:gliding motility-associated-like protein